MTNKITKSGGSPKLPTNKRNTKNGSNAVYWINTIFNSYTNGFVFVGVGFFIYLIRALTLGTLSGEAVLVEIPIVCITFWLLQSKAKSSINNRKNLFTKTLTVAFVFYLQLSLAQSFAIDAWGTLISCIILVIFIYALGTIFGKKKLPEEIHLNGSKEVNPTAYYEQKINRNLQVVESGQATPEYVGFIGLPLLLKEATTGFAFLGEARTGKSVLISGIMNTLKYADKNAMIFDASNNTLSQLLAIGLPAERIINFNPFHADCYEWNFGATFSNPAIARVFFTRVMKGAKGDVQNSSGSDDFFDKEAAALVTLVVMTLRQLAIDKGCEPLFGLKELCYICTNKTRLIETLKIYDEYWEEAEEIVDGNDQNSAVFGTLKQVFSGLKPMAECYYRARLLGRTYDMKQFRDDNKIVVLGREENIGGNFLNQWNGAIVQFVVTTILGTPTSNETKPAKTFFIFDEFEKLGKIDKLVNVSTEGGKYAMCLVLGTQSITNITKTYSRELAYSLLGSITHTAFLRLGDSETEEYASRYFGQKTVKEPSITFTEGERKSLFTRVLKKSVTWTERTKPLFDRGHFQSQPKIGVDGLMGVTVDCDGSYYRMRLGSEDITHFSAPRPTAKQEREDTKPQNEDTLHFKNLSDGELSHLGLTCLIKNKATYNQQNSTVTPDYRAEEMVTLDLDDIVFDD